MKPIVFVTTLFVLSLATQLPQKALAQVGQTSPDYDRAYELATASFCAYTVGEADADGGKQRAVQCLNAAAKLDAAGLGVFHDIDQDKVEAFYNPKAPENAYLLIQTTAGTILAFRGTLTPPISPSSGSFRAALSEAVAKEHEAGLLKTFFDDWRNNVDPRALLAVDRHPGFNDAWSGLREHLIGTECITTCSKFPSFVNALRNAASRRLYITGHSKGGALAVLAALDLSPLLGDDIATVVYTFAGAKALTATAAAQSGTAFKDMWRFEHTGDLVPSLPLDNTVPVPLLTAYAHVGNRALFTKGQPLQQSPAPVRPDDRDRLVTAAATLFASDLRSVDLLSVIASLRTLGTNNCEALVDNHFRIFVDVQETAHARHAAAPMTITEQKLDQSFFFTGLPDAKGEIIWGYSQWCRLLTAAAAK